MAVSIAISVPVLLNASFSASRPPPPVAVATTMPQISTEPYVTTSYRVWFPWNTVSLTKLKDWE